MCIASRLHIMEAGKSQCLYLIIISFSLGIQVFNHNQKLEYLHHFPTISDIQGSDCN